MVKCNIGLPEESKVSLAIQHPEQLYYCVIVDDRDIRKPIKVINTVGDKSVYVYVVVEEGVSRNEVDDRGKASAANLSSGKGSNNPIGNFKSPSKSQYHSVAENENVLPELIMYVTPKNYKYIGDNDVGTYVNDVGYGEFADCDKLDIPGLESDSNREEFDDEPKLIYSDTMFHGMPPLPSCHVNDNVNIPCQRLDINEKIKVLDIFDDKELLKLAIGTQCMEQGKQYSTTRSSK
ncbi:unnamed protein product [Lactuca saligna]|uniref:Uncharacterized protein n=1 Tax=Lactuca saligna TaxID=75948 RepID=A0AA35V2K3_LACSI|nr:unnamed protein product [Lactuca saligna]